MSGKGNCYDNACAESFFHSMKIEAIYGERFPTRHSIRQEVFEYIETFYNTIRQHSTVNGGEIMYRRGGVKMYHGLGGSLSA